MSNEWHAKSVVDVINGLHSDERGLQNAEAAVRRAEYGENKLPEAEVDGIPVIFLRQFRSPLIYLLLAASAAVFATGEAVDGLIILFVLIFNAIVGTVQEGRAQNTLQALRKFVETKTTVLRDGKEVIIPDTDLVPGDIIILQEGEKVPADLRVVFSHNLKADEAALTGESEPVYKVAEAEIGAGSAGRYKNMLYKGTNIVSGNGQGIVVAIGPQTVIGLIAGKIALMDTEIPLKGNMRYLSRLIILTVAVISVIIFVLGLVRGETAAEMFAVVISLAVSVVPEGLPIVVTLILAMGVWRMSKRNALVKKLQAVESLGQASIIAVDKTGTITKNELIIKKVFLCDKIFDIGGTGYDSAGNARLEGLDVDAANHPELLLAGKVAAFSAGARVVYSEEEKKFRISGDPTEAAMLVLAQKLGFHKDDLERESPLLAELPFDYNLKYHATLHVLEGKNFLAVVGAPEVILGLSSMLLSDGKRARMTKAARERLESIFESGSHQGLRMIAFAVGNVTGRTVNRDKIKGLTFVGFYGMEDTIRPEASPAIKQAELAGVKIVMITGDHKVTARAIAEEVGISKEKDKILTGTEIDKMNDAELAMALGSVSVFARVSPEHKMRIIEAYRSAGEVIAMTGDGVNDAPPLVAADLGVAMGKIGTEVAKEAADIVLLDDNLESIVSAIEEGRSIYKTIKKVILYLFSTSMGEVLAIMGALFLGYPLPILAAQIIWLNFVTDGFLDISLAMEPKDNNLLVGSFKKPNKYLVDGLMAGRMVLMSLVMGTGTLFVFHGYYETDMAKAWTMSLTVLAVFQWFNAWNCRSDSESLFKMNPFSNKYLIGATVIVMVLHLLALYTPLMNGILRTVPLAWSDWALVLPVAATIVVAEEIRKLHYRARRQSHLATETIEITVH